MTRCDVLVVGGTHGNEINGAWLVDPVSYTHLTLPTIYSV